MLVLNFSGKGVTYIYIYRNINPVWWGEAKIICLQEYYRLSFPD
jgi:hypothetical protein